MEDDMKKIAFMVFIFFAGGICSLFAQDVITLLNGDEIYAKVIEISSTEIRYKRFDNLDGPTIVIQKSEVFAINYENGTRDVINTISSSEGEEAKQQNTPAPRDDAPVERGQGSKFTMGILLNPVGFLTFGPVAALTMTTGMVMTNLHVRFPSLGLLMPVLDYSENYDDSVSEGIGVGIGVNFFTNRARGGFYVGGMFEYWTTRFEHDSSRYSNWYADAAGILLGLDIGYRWVFRSGLFINVGGYLGASNCTKYNWKYYDNSGGSNGEGDIYFFGMPDIAIGFNFVK